VHGLGAGHFSLDGTQYEPWVLREQEVCMNSEGGLKADGSGWRARLGVLTHDDSAISESELWTMAPDGVSLHTSRIFFADLATFADPPGPENATDLLARLPLQAIIYAWTVGSYLLGTSGEEELLRRVRQHSNGIPVLMSAPAATAAFRTLGADRIALIHGPFFTDDFDEKGVAYFQERGLEVVHVSHLLPPVEVPHPNTGSVARPDQIYEWVRGHVPSSAQAVFIGGNAVRAIGVIAALEDDLRRPILTANQVSLWYALRLAGTEGRVDNYGQLFTRPLAHAAEPTPVGRGGI
jgi:maleate isomerase